MDQLLIDYLRNLLEASDTGPSSTGGFFKLRPVGEDGELVHEVTVGLPIAEAGYPQLALDGRQAVTQDNKTGLVLRYRYTLSIWHDSDQNSLIRGSAVADELSALMHNTVTTSGLFILVTNSDSIGDVDKKLARSRIMLDVLRLK